MVSERQPRAPASTALSTTIGDQAAALHRDALVWDMTLPWEPGLPDWDGTLPRYRAAGVDFVSLTVNDHAGTLAGTMLHIAACKAQIRRRSDRMVLAATVDDILAAREAGQMALGFHFQETNPLEGSLELVQLYYDLGVRHMLLAYNRRNRVGDGCAERTDAGLSRFGVRLIEEMNRVGMLVDGSHTGYRTTMEAMEIGTAPFIFSHANAYSVVPHYRNVRDDQIEACARTGGVIGVNGLAPYLDDPEASTASIFRHVDHIASLVGPEHVGIGLDYEKDVDRFVTWTRANPEMWPQSEGKPRVDWNFAQPEQLPELTELMIRHGYPEAAIRGILGMNFLRVARQVWK
ncbi:MAG: dipeptidase [Candidatus Rokuibacteriota bacterium]